MADRTLKNFSNLAGGTSDNTDSPAIPSGKRLLFKTFLAADSTEGLLGVGADIPDSRSNLFLVQWGTVGSFTEIAFAALSGNTIQLNIDEEVIGNGSKFVRVMRKNNSGTTKRVVFILKMFDTD